MPFNSSGQYSGNFKAWDHVGNKLPGVTHSESQRPAGEFKPAPWLPVQFYDKHFENWVVIMPGKAVALDPLGYVMPAHYGLTSASVVYTANDVAAGTIDIATGSAVTAAKTVVLSTLSGVRDGSWTAATAGTAGVTSGFMGQFGVAFGDATRKYPVGVMPYAALQWAGGDGWNPTEYTFHNYNMQHQITLLCDYVLKLPLVPAQEASETVDASASGSNLVFGTQATHTRAQAQANATGRYNATTGSLPVLATDTVIALALDEQNVAQITDRTPITLASDNTSDDVSDILVTEVTSISNVSSAGKYYVDYEVGVIFIYSADGATLPTSLSGAAGTVSVTYYRYGTAPSTTAAFAQVLAGGLVPGDFLKVGANSNYTKWDPASDNAGDLIGQVLEFQVHPRDMLDRVRTSWDPALNTDSSGSMSAGSLGSSSVNTGHMDKMPGSANGGYPSEIHYAGAADQLVIVNLIGR